MPKEFNKIITVCWLRSFLFLALFYLSQIYPFYHLHHFHDEGSLGFEISSHPIDIEVKHSSDHQHDEDVPHTNDHEHRYDNNIVWRQIRIQNPKTLSLDDQYTVLSTSFVLRNENNKSQVEVNDISDIVDHYIGSFSNRGPPLFV